MKKEGWGEGVFLPAYTCTSLVALSPWFLQGDPTSAVLDWTLLLIHYGGMKLLLMKEQQQKQLNFFSTIFPIFRKFFFMIVTMERRSKKNMRYRGERWKNANVRHGGKATQSKRERERETERKGSIRTKWSWWWGYSDDDAQLPSTCSITCFNVTFKKGRENEWVNREREREKKQKEKKCSTRILLPCIFQDVCNIFLNEKRKRWRQKVREMKRKNEEKKRAGRFSWTSPLRSCKVHFHPFFNVINSKHFLLLEMSKIGWTEKIEREGKVRKRGKIRKRRERRDMNKEWRIGECEKYDFPSFSESRIFSFFLLLILMEKFAVCD